MKVGFVQFNPVFGGIDRNLTREEALIRESKAELLVLPELFNTGYLFTSKEEVLEMSEEVPDGQTTQALMAMAKKYQTTLAAGLAERRGDKIFNSAVLVTPDGYKAAYRKLHLFYEEKLWFDPGDWEPEVYDIGKCRVGLMVCFDWFFPETMRILALKGADIICHSANLVLPYCQDAMITRCLENRVIAVTANRTGVEERGGKRLHYTGRSQIVGSAADVLYRAEENTDEVGVVEVDAEKARNKKINDYNDLFEDRRTAFYGELLKPIGRS
jgi:predicted amidohydrolase